MNSKNMLSAMYTWALVYIALTLHTWWRHILMFRRDVAHKIYKCLACFCKLKNAASFNGLIVANIQSVRIWLSQGSLSMLPCFGLPTTVSTISVPRGLTKFWTHYDNTQRM